MLAGLVLPTSQTTAHFHQRPLQGANFHQLPPTSVNFRQLPPTSALCYPPLGSLLDLVHRRKGPKWPQVTLWAQRCTLIRLGCQEGPKGSTGLRVAHLAAWVSIRTYGALWVQQDHTGTAHAGCNSRGGRSGALQWHDPLTPVRRSLGEGRAGLRDTTLRHVGITRLGLPNCLQSSRQADNPPLP